MSTNERLDGVHNDKRTRVGRSELGRTGGGRDALVLQRQLHEGDVVQRLVLAGARRPHLQQEQILITIVRQHLVVNFGRNPKIITKQFLF